MQVVFLEQPVVGQSVAFFANGQRMVSSPAVQVEADPARPGWFNITTSSGSIYSGNYQPNFQPTTYATQYGPSFPPPSPPQIPMGMGGYGPRPVPPEIVGELNWGAFFLPLFWSIYHSVWIGLLCLVPGLGLIMSFVLLFKGSEWAWENRCFSSVYEFHDVQRKWMIVGIIVFCFNILIIVGHFILSMAALASLFRFSNFPKG